MWQKDTVEIKKKIVYNSYDACYVVWIKMLAVDNNTEQRGSVAEMRMLRWM